MSHKVITDSAAMDQIFAVIDGKEWDSDTLEEIAAIVSFAGYVIRSPEEAENDNATPRLV